jgi:hypothetical protein
MIIFDYDDAVHKDSGKLISLHEDIIITPFWTEEFCKELILVAEKYKTSFTKNINWNNKENNRTIGWKDLNLDYISVPFFESFVQHYKNKICPLLNDVFFVPDLVWGWFPPYIIRYDTIGDRTDLHNDQSMITLNIKLNDDYTGCDLIFPRQNFSTKDIPVGYAIIWPSTVSHPHYSDPLISGVKYSLISWSWPPSWNTNGIENS